MELVAKFIKFIIAMAFICFISFLLAWPFMILWNGCLVGAITGVNLIGWSQAWGIALMPGLVFFHQNNK